MKQRFLFLLVVVSWAGFQQGSAQIYTPYTIVTEAGLAQFDRYGTHPIGGSADGTNSVARFNYPEAVALDTNGNAYIADTFNGTIRKMTPAGVVTTIAGLATHAGSADGTNSDARFNFPNGIAVDTNGNIYVADAANETIRMITPVGMNWVVTTLAGFAGAGGTNDGYGTNALFGFLHSSVGGSWGGASGMAVDASGNLYVADNGSSTIRKIAPVGTNWQVTTFAGTPGSTGTNDGTGSAARFSQPQGVAADASGNLYVADMGNETIRKITPAGVVTTWAGQPGIMGGTDGPTNQATFKLPNGVAVDSADNVFVADADNCKIRRITRGGQVRTLAGLIPDPGTEFGEGDSDGAGDAAAFFYPIGIAVDFQDNIYITDLWNNEIRKGYPENTPAVIVGSGTSFGFTNGHFGFSLTAPAGQLAVVQASTDLLNWQPVWTNTFPGRATTNYTTLLFNDPQSGRQGACFYRVQTP